MKTKFLLFNLTSLLLCFLLISSCTQEDDTQLINTQSNLSDGTWKITKFIDSGEDETSDFSGYTFTFKSNGDLIASNGSQTYTGTWGIVDNNSSDDSQDDLELNINFMLTNDFEDLNDDWDFISNTDDDILELVDVSGGNGGTDYLTFEKK